MGNTKAQVALCATLDEELRRKIEKELLKARVSYLMKCERQRERGDKIVFYIEQYQMQEALQVAENIRQQEAKLEILCTEPE